jgi:error-prone DNA polymerase
MLVAAHTYYSLLHGTMSVETLVEKAAAQGHESLVLTDINNSSAIFDFLKLCREANIHPVFGMDFRVNGHHLYTCIARNNEGVREINEHLTTHNLEQKALSSSAPEFSNVYVLYAPGSRSLRQLREHEYIGVRPWEVNKIYKSDFQTNMHKLLAHSPVSVDSPSDYDFHRHLRAIGTNNLLDKLNPRELAHPAECLLPPGEGRKSYLLYPELLQNADALLSRCSYSLDFSIPKNKRTFTGSRYDDYRLLEKLAMDGMDYRYGKDPRAKQRLIHELKVIHELGFSAYFLITWDIIRYSMSRGIHHVGRGSGGNSIVAYCLRITDIDPIELDLYFERFINPKRTSPPDFDIDYSWLERDEVLDYIFKRYGRNHTALLGTINTFRDSSVIRELGKVYGLPKAEIDELVEKPHAVRSRDHITEKIFEYGSRLMDYPHHRSIHAGGVLISEHPITCYTALDLPPKNMPTTQWDMYVAEEIGFEKLDILSQRGIAHISECAEIVQENRGVKIDVHSVKTFKKDPRVNDKLYHGEAIGCFYIESPAMRGLLKKLKCRDYLRLVAASSIIRPGVAKSGMMREYIRRFHHPNSFHYLHPVFEDQLKETFGVMVYQEDVIKISHHFAGLDLSDADILRRAMSGKFRSKKEFERIHDTFFGNCRQRGYPPELAEEVWRQIASFSGYAFCKAHSASYAVESYQSLYLKTYFPHEFHVAVINNFGGFYRTWVYVNEARRHGAAIHLPCVNSGQYKTSIRGSDITLGFVHVKSLEIRLANRLAEERKSGGEYESLQDFMERLPEAGIEQLKILIRGGAFRFTGKTKKQLMWDAHLFLTKDKEQVQDRKLFSEKVKDYKLPPMDDHLLEDAYDEIELLEFPVSLSRFDMLQTAYRGDTLADNLSQLTGSTVRMVGDLVTIKYVHTVKKEWMHFGCFLDTRGEFFDTVHFPDSLKKYPFSGQGVYLIEGKVVEEFGYPSVEVKKMARLPYRPDPRAG